MTSVLSAHVCLLHIDDKQPTGVYSVPHKYQYIYLGLMIRIWARFLLELAELRKDFIIIFYFIPLMRVNCLFLTRFCNQSQGLTKLFNTPLRWSKWDLLGLRFAQWVYTSVTLTHWVFYACHRVYCEREWGTIFIPSIVLLCVYNESKP